MTKKEKKGLGTFQIILFTFSAVFVLDSLGLPITFGWESLIWWVILGVLFFLPYGLITSELSSTYGSEGGIYNWTKRAYGSKMAGRSNYFYWINVALWMPAVYLVLGDTMAYAIVDHSEGVENVMQKDWWVWASVGIAIIATWITVYVNTLPLEEAAWIPSISSIIKISLVAILFVSMIVYLIEGDPAAGDNLVQTPFLDPEKGGIQPHFGSSTAIIGIIVYNMCGFELGTNVEVKDVKKTMVKAIGIGGLTIIGAYILASIPILVMVNTNGAEFEEYYTASIVLALQVVCPDWFVIICAILLALTLFGNMCTWTLGANGAIVEAAENEQFVSSFAKTNKHGSPYIAAFWCGIVSTITLLIAGVLIAISGGSLWYIVFSFSLVVFFMPYMIIFLGYIKLRKLYPDEERPFSIKSDFLAKTIGWLAFVVIVIATFAQLFDINISNEIAGKGNIKITPNAEIGWIGILLTLVGLAIVIGAGEYLITCGNKKSKNGPTKPGPKINNSIKKELEKEIMKENQVTKQKIKINLNKVIYSKEKQYVKNLKNFA